MIAFACYIAAALGFAYVVGQSRISLPVRSLLAHFVAVTSPVDCRTCGKHLRFMPRPDFAAPVGTCPTGHPHSPDHFDAERYWYPFKWVLLLAECPACLSVWVGAGVALFAPDLAAAVVPAPFVGPVPLALLTCGAVAFLSNLAGISGDPHDV